MNYEEMNNEDIKMANDHLVAVIEQLLSTKLTDGLTTASDCNSTCFAEYNQCVANGTGLLVCSANLRGCIVVCP